MKVDLNTLMSSNKGGFYLMVGSERDVDALQDTIAAERESIIAKTIRGSRCKTKELLFQEFAAALQFPYYFGHNWDAFDECITDLSWLHAKKYTLIISNFNNVLEDDRDELRVFFIVLKDAVIEWSKNNKSRPIESATPLQIVFHSESQNEAECIRILEKEMIPVEILELKALSEEESL